MKRVSIVMVCMLVAAAAFSQELSRNAYQDSVFRMQPVSTFAPVASISYKNEQAIPQNFYTQQFGFFCKQELKMQEAHIPVTFRLGSMDYCNYLEQKAGYR